MKTTLNIGLFVMAATLAMPAMGQWVWKDDNGRNVYSDQPPPIGIPPARILKTPRGNPLPEPILPPEQTAEPGANQPKTLADRDLEYRKRQEEQKEAEKKRAEEEAKAKAKQERCAGLRKNMATLEQGGRVAERSESGELSYVDDSARQSRLNNYRQQYSKECQ